MICKGQGVFLRREWHEVWDSRVSEWVSGALSPLVTNRPVPYSCTYRLLGKRLIDLSLRNES